MCLRKMGRGAAMLSSAAASQTHCLWVLEPCARHAAQPQHKAPGLPCCGGVLCAGAGDDSYTFPLWKKLVAGGISGCIGAAIANPTGGWGRVNYPQLQC